MYNVSLLLHLFIFFLDCLFITNCARTFWYAQSATGSSVPHNTARKSPNTFDSAAPRTYSIICISSESCLGSIVGLPGSHVLLPYVPLYRLRRHRENYCDCVPAHLDEHLSRESRKLTDMMRRELVAVREVSNP